MDNELRNGAWVVVVAGKLGLGTIGRVFNLDVSWTGPKHNVSHQTMCVTDMFTGKVIRRIPSKNVRVIDSI